MQWITKATRTPMQLDAASERLFWAIVANENLITVGTDVANAFTEARLQKPRCIYT